METTETQPIKARIRIDYLGPVAPHWEAIGLAGDKATLEDFSQRIYARLSMLPPHDPQFRRNRERIQRDAEREGVLVIWSLDEDH